MKKTLVLLMTAILLLACLSGCGEKEPEKEEEVRVEITMENFREYFEFTTFADWDEYYLNTSEKTRAFKHEMNRSRHSNASNAQKAL